MLRFLFSAIPGVFSLPTLKGKSSSFIISASTICSSTPAPSHRKWHHALMRVTDWTQHVAMASVLPGSIQRFLKRSRTRFHPPPQSWRHQPGHKTLRASNPIKHSWDVTDQIQSSPHLPSNTEPDNRRKSSEVQAARGQGGHYEEQIHHQAGQSKDQRHINGCWVYSSV